MALFAAISRSTASNGKKHQRTVRQSFNWRRRDQMAGSSGQFLI